MKSIVADNIQKRVREREAGQTEPREFKTALVIQGGTLRSVASCGAAAALNALGLTNAFDTVYGLSSGAINAAYFLSNQAALGVTVYLEDANQPRFINFCRFHKIMDLDYLINEVILGHKRHNEAAFRKHQTELKIMATDADTTETVLFSSRDKTINLYDALKASCALPLLHRGGVKVGGRRCIDGFINEPLPLLSALNQDYTDILVLMTRHISERDTGELGFLERILIGPLTRLEIGDKLYQRYRDRWKRYNYAADIVQSGVYRRDDGKVTRIGYICPDKEAKAHRFEMKKERLFEAAFSAWANTFRFFSGEHKGTRSEFEQILLEAKRKSLQSGCK